MATYTNKYDLQQGNHRFKTCDSKELTKIFWPSHCHGLIASKEMFELLTKNVCIDEQMVPFRGQLTMKQYVKGKPHPWGIKVFMLCSNNGLAYDFLLYQGATTDLDENILKNYGFAAAVVMKLSNRLDEKGYYLYFDNYFSTYPLLKHLIKKIYMWHAPFEQIDSKIHLSTL